MKLYQCQCFKSIYKVFKKNIAAFNNKPHVLLLAYNEKFVKIITGEFSHRKTLELP